MGLFEIGLVYRKGPQVFIAVDERTLITCKDGREVEVRPTTKYDVVRSMSVEEISDHWGVTLDEFDRLVGKHLGPPAGAVKSRPRGTRRKTEDEDDYWKRTRTGRIARPRL